MKKMIFSSIFLKSFFNTNFFKSDDFEQLILDNFYLLYTDNQYQALILELSF